MSVPNPRKIKSDADHLLKRQGVEALMLRFGEITYSGSYALDLMVWNDIDLYIKPNNSKSFCECAADLARAFVNREDVDIVKVEKLASKRMAVPKGIYVGVKIPSPNYKLPWKLDIWLVDKEERDKNETYLNSIRSQIKDPEIKSRIINAKIALITPEGRTPSMSSVQVYKAVLELGISDPTEVKKYVLSLGREKIRKTRIY